MSDTVGKDVRSRIMAQVKSKGNKSTELKVMELLRQYGITGWRRHWPIAGRPDFAFPKSKVALFIDGCFWHGHNCRNLTPAQNSDYWNAKRERNQRRDRAVTKQLRAAGWHVIRIWECELEKRRHAKKLRALENLLLAV
jgi:DNA mismatch endonuclease (patch repair protein)